jgi:hypothetical protein
MWILVFPAPFVIEAVFSPMYVFGTFVKNQMVVEFLSPPLYSIGLCLFLCQCHVFFVTMALYYNLKSGIKILTASLFCSRLLWLFGVFCASI